MDDKTKNDGGPAFPQMTAHADVSGAISGIIQAHPGLTIRDWFAGQLLSGMGSMSSEQIRRTEALAMTKGKTTARCLAESAYEMADAMLKARNGQ